MKNEFTVEESNLISIYTEEGTASGLGSRAKVIKRVSVMQWSIWKMMR